MKIKEIEGVVDAAPQERAELYLRMGAEMATKKPGKPLPPGKLPAALKRESVVGGIAGPMIQSMHGVGKVEVTEAKGLKGTGMKLKTAAGVVPELTLNLRSRKGVVADAMNREDDRSVDDLMIRQLAVGMMDSSPISRISAAYGYWQATAAEAVSAPVLSNATRMEDDDEESQFEEERMLAAHSLFHVNSRKVAHMVGKGDEAEPNFLESVPSEKNSMTVLIHGTFATKSAWYKPGGEFHTYIKEEVYPDVYSDPDDFYSWSGGYSLNNTSLKNIWKKAATRLVAWCEAHPAKTLRLIAHSHGANVVNLATQMGLPACTLIQLSVPVRDWNLPDMTKVSSNTLFNIHSHVDLVVGIDGGAQSYKKTSVAKSEKKKIIGAFGHSASHDEKKWAKKDVPKLVKTVCP